MSVLKPGTRCVIVAGCSENIGLIVEVVRRDSLTRHGVDQYVIRTVSRRHFQQLWEGNDLLRGDTSVAVTDRYKLRPLVDPNAPQWNDSEAMPASKELSAQKV